MRYRWLDDEGIVEYRGRHNPTLREKRGQILVLPLPRAGGRRKAGAVGNCLVQFEDGTRAICPAGTLRMVRRMD